MRIFNIGTIPVNHLNNMDLGSRFGEFWWFLDQGISIPKKIQSLTPHDFAHSLAQSDQNILLMVQKSEEKATWHVWNPVNNGINYQPQLVIAGFLNHQTNAFKVPASGLLFFRHHLHASLTLKLFQLRLRQSGFESF